MQTEILVYLQKVKNYLSSNDEARDYFIGSSDIDEFYKHLTIISEKNFEDNGQPELTKEQFELLRKTILAVTISKQDVIYSEDGIFMFFKDYPPTSMN